MSGCVRAWLEPVQEHPAIETSGTRDLYAENSGIAIIFPSWLLHEILDLDELRNRIGELVGPESPK